ncbi:MAG: hypothetical protein WDO56_14905 [Gammaproteobacteria bacterium]
MALAQAAVALSLSLGVVATAIAASASASADAAIAASRAQWRSGDLKAAQATTEKALKRAVTADLAQQEALLLEAGGEPVKAQEWYRKALQLSTDPQQQALLRLRLTFVGLGQQDVSQLVTLARGRDREFRNRAAVALAVLGHYDEANHLYTIFGETSERFRQHLRLAQWALEAGNAGMAQEEAWHAVALATAERDRRYSLSVLVEAHESDKSLDRLLQRLDNEKQLTPEQQDVRIDLLRELARYDEAIALFKKTAGAALTADSRRQLLRMYSDAGRDAEMIVEYGKLIDAEPDQVAWPEGLSQYLMEHGDAAAARKVWQQFIERTQKPTALLAGARAMSRFGLDDLAGSAADKCVALDSARAVDARLFQFELFRGRGASDKAQSVLVELDRALPPDDAHRVELSYAFERIRQPMQALAVLEALGRHKAGGLDRDETMRMAWLYDNTGQRDRALATWKALWDGSASDSSRRIVEDRLVALAAETGALGDLAVELEARLAAGKASRKDSALLIRIYTDAQDPAAAVEVIEEYLRATGASRAADIASLKEQSRVYRALGEGKAFRSVTTRLLALDPENRLDYLQALILSRVESASAAADDADGSQLRRWLDELRKATPGAGVEFEAGVLVLAGLDDQAIDAYRRALAANPAHSDNYLLWADLLKKSSREAEAIAGLQYLVENATRDDAFVVGIDGLLNMQSRDPEVIRWAQRRVLERLTAHDDKLYLYDLLAELAEEARDSAVYFAALESSLAYADSRRSNVLRELISASAEAGRSQFREPDLERNLRYSRRLVALREALPPDVYMNMGKAFLKNGAEDSAAQAFNLAFDRTGQDSLIEETGDLFRAAGYARQASAQYERALIGDAGNFGIMSKLAAVKLLQGRVDESHALYLKAMLGLLNSQSLQADAQVSDSVADLSSTTTFAYRSSYKTLLAGVVATLPARSEQSFAAVQEAFDGALRVTVERAADRSLKGIGSYPRLRVLSQFARTLGLRTAHYDYAERLDARLLEHFSHDSALVSEIVSERLVWGLVAPAAKLAPPETVAAEASRLKVREQAVASALLQADQARALAVYRDWFKAVAATRAGVGDAGPPRRTTADIVIHARANLDAEHYIAFSRYAFDLMSGHPEYAADLVYGAGRDFVDARAADSILLHLEQTVGRQLFTEAQLRRVIDMPHAAGGELDGVYVTSRLPPERQVEDFGRLLTGNSEGRVNAAPALATLKIILSRALSAQDSARLDEVFKERLRQIRIDRELELAGFIRVMTDAHLALAIHRDNIGLLESWDGYLARTYPDSASPGVLKINLLRDLGREREAVPFVVDTALARYVRPNAGGGVMMLMAVPASGAAPEPSDDEKGRDSMARYLGSMNGLLYPAHRDDALALAGRREKELGLTPAVLALQTLLRQLDPEQDSAHLQAWLKEKAARYPDDARILIQLQESERRGDAAVPGSDVPLVAAAAPASAGATAAASAAAAPMNLPSAGVTVGARSVSALDDPVFGSLEVRQALQKIFALDSGGSVDEARAALRDLWRMTLIMGMDPSISSMMAGSDGISAYFDYRFLFDLNWDAAVTRRSGAGTFLENLAQHDFAFAELEAQMHALSPNAIDEQHQLYSLLAAVCDRTGRLPAEVQRLTAEIEAGRGGSKELVLWLELIARLPIEQMRERLPFAERKIAELGVAGGYPRLLIARDYAAIGNSEKAVAAYHQAFIARFSPLRFPNGSNPLFTAYGLYEDARARLNATDLDQLLSGLLRLVAPDDDPDRRASYARFIMGLLDRDPGSRVAQSQFASLLKSGTAFPAAVDQVNAVRLQARLGHYSAALDLLKTVLKRTINHAGSRSSGGSGPSSWQYDAMLSIRRGVRPDPETDYALLQGLFPGDAQPWPEERVWFAQLTAAVSGWTERGEVNGDAGAAALSVLARHSIPKT